MPEWCRWPSRRPSPSPSVSPVPVPWWRSRSSWTHSRTRSSRAAGFTSPVTNGAIAASHATASAASPSSHAPPSLPPAEAAARCPAHRARTRAVHSSSNAELPSSIIRSANDMCSQALTGCPARSGSSPAVDQPPHRLVQPIVDTAAPGCGCPPPRPGPTAHPAPPAPPRHTPASSPRAAPPRRRTSSPAAPTGPRTPRLYRRRDSQAATGRRSPPASPPRSRRSIPVPAAAEQDLIRIRAAVLRQLVRPPADGPRERLRHLPGRQCRGDPGVPGGPADPRGVRRQLRPW